MNSIDQNSYDYRFNGIERLYGAGSLNQLKKIHIAIIGIGGVGSWAAEYLARTGVGNITLIDLDDICYSNTNRQIHALDSTVGKLKTQTMKQRILDINPECEVNCVERFYSEKNFEQILSIKYDYIIDAFDDARYKAHLVAECYQRGQKLFVSGGAASRIRPELVQVVDLALTYQDPLLFKIRKDLIKKYGILKTYQDGRQRKKLGIPCVFSPEPMIEPKACESDKPQKMNCHTGYGSASFLTSNFANLAVAYILNDLLGKNN